MQVKVAPKLGKHEAMRPGRNRFSGLGHTRPACRLIPSVSPRLQSKIPYSVCDGAGIQERRNRRSAMQRLALLALTLFFAAQAFSQVSFKFAPINVPGATATQARGINGSGEVVGFRAVLPRATSW